MRILREADRDTVPEVAKRHGVSEVSIYAWRTTLSPIRQRAGVCQYGAFEMGAPGADRDSAD